MQNDGKLIQNAAGITPNKNAGQVMLTLRINDSKQSKPRLFFEVFLRQHFSNLHRIERSALTQIV